MAQARKGKGTPQPQPDDDDDGGDDEFTDAQLGRITGIVNAAVSGQLQRKLPKAISDGIAGPIGELKTLLEGNGGNRGRQRADDDGGDDDDEDEPPAPKRGKGKRGRGDDDRVSAMQKKIDALETERRTEREQTQARERDGALREHLSKIGVDPNRIRGAIAVIRENTKRDDKTGEWYYTAKRDGFDEDLDLAAGVGEWGKSDEGKSYLATQGQQQQPRGGSGTRVQTGAVIGTSGGSMSRGSSGTDPKTAKAAQKAEAVKQLNEAVASIAGGGIPLG